MRSQESTSSVRCYRLCPRKYYYTRALDYEPIKEAPALYIGTVAHRALNAYYIARWWGARKLGPIKQTLAELSREPDVWVRAKVEAMMIGYHARWCDDGLKVLDVERTFETSVGNERTCAECKICVGSGIVLDIVTAAERTCEQCDGRGYIVYGFRGRFDAEVLNGNSYYVLEHKTTGYDMSSGSQYWRQLQLDPQISDYWMGAAATGRTPDGVVYDVLRKPDLKPRDTESPDAYRDRCIETIAKAPEKYYQRRVIVRLEYEREDAMRNLEGTLVQIRRSYEDKSWPANYDACGRYGETCEFLPVCAGQATLDNKRLYRRKS